MNQINLELIGEFLNEYHHDFQEFLETKEIEPTEADQIIDSLKAQITNVKVEDLRKAEWYLKRVIQKLEKVSS